MIRTAIVVIALIAGLEVCAQQPVVDGVLDPNYVSVGSGSGGSFTDVIIQELYYYPYHQPSGEDTLYIFIEGDLPVAETGDPTVTDGFGLFLNFTELDGAPPDFSLGVNPTVGPENDNEGLLHFLNGNQANEDGSEELNFTSECEVDYMFAFNTNDSPGIIYYDVLQHYSSGNYNFQVGGLGSSDQAGTVITNSGTEVFDTGTVRLAFVNDSGTRGNGVEMAIPYNQLKSEDGSTTVTHVGLVQLSAIVVSSTAYFSTNAVPAVSTAQGFEPQFGEFCSQFLVLPLKFVSANLETDSSGKIKIHWTVTSSETITKFVVQGSNNGIDFYDLNDVISVNGQTHYELILLADYSYYRLKAVSTAEVDLYSEVLVNNVLSNSTFQLISLPDENAIKFYSSEPSDKLFNLSVYNLYGQNVFTAPVRHNEIISTSQLTTGMYIGIISNEEGRIIYQTKIMIK